MTLKSNRTIILNVYSLDILNVIIAIQTETNFACKMRSKSWWEVEAKHMTICMLLVHISYINKYWKQQREWKFLSMWGMLHVYSSMHVTHVSSYLTAAIFGQYFTALQRTCLSIIWSLSEDKCTKSHVNLLTAQNI